MEFENGQEHALDADESQRFTSRMNSISRRRFLQGIVASAGLVIAWSSVPANSLKPLAKAQRAKRSLPTNVDSYLAVNANGTITLATGKVEFGQGIQTGFAQLVAEELDVPLERIKVIMGITDQAPYDIGTFGSASTRRTGPIIRKAAAEMRQWLAELGSNSLGLSIDQVITKDGAVVAVNDGNASVSYADLASDMQVMREIGDNTRLKDPGTYTIVGADAPRIDLPAKVNGEMKFGYDVTIEGMVHGKIVRPPALSATLLDIDFSAAEKMPGVIGTFRNGDFAGLAAERRDQAEAALAVVKARWSEVNTGNTSDNIYALIKRTADAGQVLDAKPGDPDSALAGAVSTVTATFRAPYVSHAPLEPKTSLVRISPDRVDVWTSTQAPFRDQAAVAALLGRPLDEVVVTPMMCGGAFDSKVTTVSELEATRLAQAFDRPVKIQWTRQEEFQFGQFRPAAQSEIKAGLDADGNLVAWKHDLYSSNYFPEGAESAMSGGAAAGANILDVYGLPNTKTTWYKGHSPLPVYMWRGNNGTSHNVMAHECVIDELAERAGKDPVTFRSGLLTDNPRMKALMDVVVKKAGWIPGVGSTGRGFGIAISYTDDTYIAQVAQAKVDTSTGQIVVKHIDVAVDCGLVVNPQGATLQIEGGVIFSLSPTLREMVTFDNGKVTNASYNQYQPIRMNEVPTIDVIFVEDKAQPMGGVGEPGCASVPDAVSNAVYDAIGVRLREIPFTPDRVLAAIKDQSEA